MCVCVCVCVCINALKTYLQQKPAENHKNTIKLLKQTKIEK